MTCRACDGRCDPVFAMEPMPLAGAFASTIEEALDSPRYPLTWARCRTCGLVNVVEDIPDDMLYRTYRYAASQVPALVRHHAEYAAFLRARHAGPVRLLEIGSNDGVLLRHLPEWDVVGVDPSDIDSGDLPRIREPFTSGLARALGTFDIVTASNSFAHFTGIGDAIEGIARALKPDGTAYIEVHDLRATLASGQWDTIYHEHKVEWSAAALRVAFRPHGLRLTELYRLPLHGGLLRAVFVKAPPRTLAPGPVPDFAPLRAAYVNRRESPAYREMAMGGAAYGAAARATVYLNQLPELPLGFVVDGSPRRAGRFVPGVTLPIVTPDLFDAKQPRRTLITAWTHAADIKARHPDYDRWITAW